MQTSQISGYKFIKIDRPDLLRNQWEQQATSLQLKGTILLSHEGVNINLAGSPSALATFQACLAQLPDFTGMRFHQTQSDTPPYRRLKVKVKNEIITLRQADVEPTQHRAPAVTPSELKNWLDHKRDITLLDTRNDYEYRFGTFKDAMNLQMNQFGEFPDAVTQLDKRKPVVMFCTGGIRCEKAALVMLKQGFEEVYQLDTGILGYFAAVGGAHYEGDCFVFDERVALKPNLEPTGSLQCKICQGPMRADAISSHPCLHPHHESTFEENPLAAVSC